MSTTAIVQARMGSTRLPGKVLALFAGRPALWHVIHRLRMATSLTQVVIATTTDQRDDVIEQFCQDQQIPCFRGSEEDVLDRYYRAAKQFAADPVVRITSDCPAIDPTIVDEVVAGYFTGGYDVYGLGGEFPDGLDCTVFSMAALEDTWKCAVLPSEREHVCPYMENHPEKFRIGSHEKFAGLGHHRWTLDEEADLVFLQNLFTRLYRPGEVFLTQDILRLLEREPHLMRLNRGILRNEGYLKSLQEDEAFLDRSSVPEVKSEIE